MAKRQKAADFSSVQADSPEIVDPELYSANLKTLLDAWRAAESPEEKQELLEIMALACEDEGELREGGYVPFTQLGGGNPDLQNRVNSWNRITKTVRKIDKDAAVELEHMFTGASNAKVGKTMGERTEITTQFYIEAADKVRAWHTEILDRYAGREEFYQIENQLNKLEPEVPAVLRFNKICSEKVLNTEES